MRISKAWWAGIIGRYINLRTVGPGRKPRPVDLTQQTFYIWAIKGHQLLAGAKVKTWSFTMLYREFLKTKRRWGRFLRVELDRACPERRRPKVNRG